MAFWYSKRYATWWDMLAATAITNRLIILTWIPLNSKSTTASCIFKPTQLNRLIISIIIIVAHHHPSTENRRSFWLGCFWPPGWTAQIRCASYKMISTIIWLFPVLSASHHCVLVCTLVCTCMCGGTGFQISTFYYLQQYLITIRTNE